MNLPRSIFSAALIGAAMLAGTAATAKGAPGRGETGTASAPPAGRVTRDQVVADYYAARRSGAIPEICADYDIAHTRLRPAQRN